MRTPQKNTKNTGTSNRIKTLFVAAAVTAGLGLGACGTGALEVNEVAGGATTEAPVQADSASTNESTGASKAQEAPADDEISYEATETVIHPETGEEIPVVVFEAPSTPEDDLLDAEWDENDNQRDVYDHEVFEGNDRFGFNHGVPQGFELVNRADNGDGTTWVDAQAGVELRVFGTYVLEESQLVGDELPMYTHNGVEPIITGHATETYFLFGKTDSSDWEITSEFNTGEYYVVVSVVGSQERAFEVHSEVVGSLFLTDPAGADPEYSDEDIATIPEDELLGYDDSAGDTNNIEDPRGDQPLGEPQFIRNEFFGFSYSLDNGFELTNHDLAAMGLEHHNKWIDTTVRVFGEFETLDLGDYMGEVALYNADGSNGRSAPIYMSVPQRLDNGNLLIRSAIDIGSHVVIIEVEGPDNMAWDTHQSVDLSLAVFDQVPMDSPA